MSRQLQSTEDKVLRFTKTEKVNLFRQALFIGEQAKIT